jgi:hypothetical protein
VRRKVPSFVRRWKPAWSRCVGLTVEFAIELDLLQEGIAGST